MKETSFSIDGMSCSGCANSISAALNARDGIVKTKVDFDTRKAVVQYDEKKTSEEQIFTVLKEMGYGFRRHAGKRAPA